MKKKTDNKLVDPFSQFPSAEMVITSMPIINKSKIDYNGPPVPTIANKNDEDKHSAQLEKLDNWCEKWLDKNKNAKLVKGEYYPYKDYTVIEELIRKHGSELIEHVLNECPLKGKEIRQEIHDSIAFTIFRKKIDPKSLFSVPTYKSFWDKISDCGYT